MRSIGRHQAQRWITYGLVILAFANSYRHGVSWALTHSPADQPAIWAWLIAALPELLVVLSVLGFPENRWGWRTLVPGSMAVAWTLWANGSAAAGGVSGLFIALSPALVSLIGLALSHGSDESVVVAQRLNPEAMSHRASPRKAQLSAVSAAVEPTRVSATARVDGGVSQSQLKAQRVAWAQAQSVMPTSSEIMSHTDCSLATAKRVRSAALESAAV